MIAEESPKNMAASLFGSEPFDAKEVACAKTWGLTAAIQATTPWYFESKRINTPIPDADAKRMALYLLFALRTLELIGDDRKKVHAPYRPRKGDPEELQKIQRIHFIAFRKNRNGTSLFYKPNQKHCRIALAYVQEVADDFLRFGRLGVSKQLTAYVAAKRLEFGIPQPSRGDAPSVASSSGLQGGPV